MICQQDLKSTYGLSSHAIQATRACLQMQLACHQVHATPVNGLSSPLKPSVMLPADLGRALLMMIGCNRWMCAPRVWKSHPQKTQACQRMNHLGLSLPPSRLQHRQQGLVRCPAAVSERSPPTPPGRGPVHHPESLQSMHRPMALYCICIASSVVQL